MNYLIFFLKLIVFIYRICFFYVLSMSNKQYFFDLTDDDSYTFNYSNVVNNNTYKNSLFNANNIARCNVFKCQSQSNLIPDDIIEDKYQCEISNIIDKERSINSFYLKKCYYPYQYCYSDKSRLIYLSSTNENNSFVKVMNDANISNNNNIFHISKECRYSTNMLPGDSCFYNYNCISNYCIFGVCQGSKRYSRCFKHEDCNIGLACFNNICNIQITDDNSSYNPVNKYNSYKHYDVVNGYCEDDYQCENNHGCFNHKCIKYFSIESGSNSTSRRFCKSKELINGVCSDIILVENETSNSNILNTLVSKNNISLKQRFDFKCNSNGYNYCKYKVVSNTNEDIYFTKPCICTFGDPEYLYCEKDNSNMFKNLTKDIIKHINKKTHTKNRNIYYDSIPDNLVRLNEFPLLEQSDNCLIKELINIFNYLNFSKVILIISIVIYI